MDTAVWWGWIQRHYGHKVYVQKIGNKRGDSIQTDIKISETTDDADDVWMLHYGLVKSNVYYQLVLNKKKNKNFGNNNHRYT